MQYIHNNNKTEYFGIGPKGNEVIFPVKMLAFVFLSLMLDLRPVKACTYEQHQVFSQIIYIRKSSLEFLCVVINALVSLGNAFALFAFTEAGLCAVQPASEHSGERKSYSPHSGCHWFHSEANNFITIETGLIRQAQSLNSFY